MGQGGSSRDEGTERSKGASDERSEVAAAAAAPGLVYFGTSRTEATEPIIIDSAEARIRAMRKSVLTSARLLDEGLRDGGFRYRAAMLTVTYANGDDWRWGTATGE